MDTKDILEEIYYYLDRAEAVVHLQPVDKGNYYLINCPSCNKREAFIYKTGNPRIQCNRRDKCMYSKSLWDYIQESKNLSQQETLLNLAQMANYRLPDKEVSWEAIEKQKKNEDILEAALNYFLLPENKAQANTYLLSRGFTENEAEMSDIGFYTSQTGLKSYLTENQFDSSIFQDTGLFIKGLGETHQFSIPYRDSAGRLKGFIFRTDKATPKYLYNKTLERDSFFNFEKCNREKTVIIVEGFIDAVLASLRGIKGVVAIGGASFAKNQLEKAIKYGAKNFILALDNDKAGQEGTEKALHDIKAKGLKSYVFTYPDKPYYKDPDELIRGEGIEEFNNRIKYALSGSAYIAHRLRQKYGDLLKTDRGISDYIEEALMYEETIIDTLESKDFLSSICSELWIQPEDLEPRRKSYKQKKAEEKAKGAYKNLLKESDRLLQNGKIKELEHFLEEGWKSIKIGYEKAIIKPSVSLSSYLLNKYTVESTRDANSLLGYTLNKFKMLEHDIDGLQPGFYILAAKTNIGKTAFLSNIFLDIIESNKDVVGLYFSLDDNRDIVINRFLGIMTNLNLNQVQRKQHNSFQQEKIKNAYDTLIEYADSGRIIIKDIADVNNVDNLEIEIREQAKSKLFVMIDGLYNLEVGEVYGGIREENIERANKVKALVDSYKIPIIVTGEVRKDIKGESKNKIPELDDLMETGKFAYNANLVWMLHPEDIEDFRENEEPILTLSYSKNKLSFFKGYRKLVFVRAKGILREKEIEEAVKFDEITKASGLF